ncbi:MAG: glycosyltransferase family 2 protein [Mycoplasmatales bacterium]
MKAHTTEKTKENSKEQQIILSICISSYNNLPYIKQLINLIDKEIDILENKVEVLVVDDCSNDGTKDFLNELDKKKFRITINAERKKTPSFGRNLMILQAVGEYILFIDGDDIFTAPIEEIVLELLTKNEAEMLLSFPHFCSVQNHLTDCNIKYCKRIYECTDEDFEQNALKYAVHQTGIWNIYKRSFLKENQLCFPTTMRSEDHLFTHNVLAKRPKFGRLNVRYYGWRLNEQSHSNSKNVRENNIMFLEYALKNISIYLDVETKNEIIFNLFNTTLSNMIRGYPKMDVEERYHYFQKIKKLLKNVKYTGDYRGTDIYFIIWYKYRMKSYYVAELLYRIYEKKNNV